MPWGWLMAIRLACFFLLLLFHNAMKVNLNRLQLISSYEIGGKSLAKVPLITFCVFLCHTNTHAEQTHTHTLLFLSCPWLHQLLNSTCATCDLMILQFSEI